MESSDTPGRFRSAVLLVDAIGMRTTQDSDRPGMGRGMDLGRTQSIHALMRHREAVEQRLSSSLRQAELVDSALGELDHSWPTPVRPGRGTL
jgi:hypothetical protein